MKHLTAATMCVVIIGVFLSITYFGLRAAAIQQGRMQDRYQEQYHVANQQQSRVTVDADR